MKRQNVSTEKQNDEIGELLQMLKKDQRNPEKAFVRKVDNSGDPCFVVGTQHQLMILLNFAPGQPAKLSFLGVNATFSFMRYYVTLTTYCYLMLGTREWINPARTGTILLHHKKEKGSYYELASTMAKLNPAKTQSRRSGL